MAIMEIRNLTRRFGGLIAVNEVSLTIAEETIHSIIGPNGAGKTTLFNLITGMFPPSRGSVLFLGEDITGWAPGKLNARGIARTFQITSVFGGLSVEENVLLALRSRSGDGYSWWRGRRHESSWHNAAVALLDEVGLAAHADEVAGALAHGQQRALDIAIGLASEPKILFMDEPLAGMSHGDRRTVGKLITDLRRRRRMTVVLVEHDMGMVMELSDHITVLENGKVIASDVPSGIRNNRAVQEAYLKGSFKGGV